MADPTTPKLIHSQPMTSAQAVALVSTRMGPVTDFHVHVLTELATQVRNRGWLTDDLTRAGLLIMEEAGEVAAGCLQCTRPLGGLQDFEALYTELIHMGSLAYQLAYTVAAVIGHEEGKAE